MSDNAIPKNDSIKFWTFLTIMLLAVAIAVTLIDLTIKAAILAESNALKIEMEEWEVRHGPKQAGRIDARNSDNNSHNGNLPGDVLDSGNAGMETGSSNEGDKKPFPTRARNGRFTSPSSGD